LFQRRQTNRIDIEYLYYLLFCDAFSSSDVVHTALASHLLGENQMFFTGDDLKLVIQDILHIHDSGQLGDAVESGPYPELPRRNQSCIYQTWRKAGFAKD